MQKSRFVICKIYAFFPARNIYRICRDTELFLWRSANGLYIFTLKPELLAIRIIKKDIGFSQIHGISHWKSIRRVFMLNSRFFFASHQKTKAIIYRLYTTKSRTTYIISLAIRTLYKQVHEDTCTKRCVENMQVWSLWWACIHVHNTLACNMQVLVQSLPCL